MVEELTRRDGEPSSLKLSITSRTRSSDVNANGAICGTAMPWADHNTTWARRHVTTDPSPRRTIRSSRLPSSLVISRTRNGCIPASTQTPARYWWTRPLRTFPVTALGDALNYGMHVDSGWNVGSSANEATCTYAYPDDVSE